MPRFYFHIRSRAALSCVMRRVCICPTSMRLGQKPASLQKSSAPNTGVAERAPTSRSLVPTVQQTTTMPAFVDLEC
jgi:hypothetical protein